jgi:hypothetical protein
MKIQELSVTYLIVSNNRVHIGSENTINERRAVNEMRIARERNNVISYLTPWL